MASLDSALVLFSGGQDSTVCLAWALERFARVETIGFAYGQRHAVELEVRPRVRAALAAQSQIWRERLGEDHVIRIDALAEISETALTREAERIGFPLMVKAAAGGGGRGMRLVAAKKDLAAALSGARAEAENAFGSGELIRQ